MNPSQLSIALLAVLILVISIWWVFRTLKEGRKAVEEMKRDKLNNHSASLGTKSFFYSILKT